ncbi:MAG: glycosyltransferase [Deltaproteobacteria bacterium]
MSAASRARPLVSCIMPTYNRRPFIAQALAYFQRQDYDPQELIIVDDGTDSIRDLIPSDSRIRYIRLENKLTIGAKRNLACEQAQGDIIAHWDDDDWYAPYRLSYQTEALRQAGAEVCGTNRLRFYDLDTRRAWEYVYPAHLRFWLSGNTLCYRRAFWVNHPFEDINVGEDGRFVWSGDPKRMVALPDTTFHVGLIHGNNASPKQTQGAYWRSFPVEVIQGILGKDWSFYGGVLGEKTASQVVPAQLPVVERTIPTMTPAKTGHLSLPEYAAFNHGLNLPRMRRWELPFALFQARLPNTGSVLDCTINPAGFQERLHGLYPHILYRHWNPIPKGKFVLPFGVPDEVFDRVFCINTLEHLLKPQREALIAALSRKLKPGGWLILTSDYYFDSFWQQPAFLNLGVMRPDRREVFNGWNKVTPREWVDLCSRHDIHPLSEVIDDPGEDDLTLYRQDQPYPHACLGGVFYKSHPGALPAGKKIVLALLTWNTCDVSLDSVRCYVREAHMLRRLGQEPHICVCDNGSVDGTAEALRQLRAAIDVPFQLICNPENLGSSRARNQIIDYMLEIDADYLLFMDGDIEIVPFSSFAMLRYLENNGRRLGCIGADSAGQTPFRERASSSFYSINRVETTNLVAWTQYGMFRRAVFADGIRFDESAPFNGAGWGFEDNDLAFQMDTKGYVNQRFFDLTYLHREARSSIRVMRRLGMDVNALYEQRKHYIIHKWSAIPTINNGPLLDIRRISINF